MMSPMALTQKVKSELAAVATPHPNARRAEVATMLRFGGGLHLVGGRIVIEAELDSAAAARRLRTFIHNLYSLDSDLLVINATGLRRTTRYAVRVIRDGEALARLTGLVDQRRRPVRGLPAVVVGGSIADSVAVWRGAFLARGSLTEPGRSMALEVTCPGSEAALALSGAARRLGITVKSRESRGVDRVVLRDGEAIADLLTRMGAQETRSARAAVAASARVERALEILGEDAPGHLVAAGRLRIEHRQASLEELGKLHEPPLTKDAVAGRIRRLLATADKAAEAAGIPNTEASLPAELNDSQ